MYPVLFDSANDSLWFACPPKERGRAYQASAFRLHWRDSSLSLSRCSQLLRKGCAHQCNTYEAGKTRARHSLHSSCARFLYGGVPLAHLSALRQCVSAVILLLFPSVLSIYRLSKREGLSIATRPLRVFINTIKLACHAVDILFCSSLCITTQVILNTNITLLSEPRHLQVSQHFYQWLIHSLTTKAQFLSDL